MPRSVAGVYTLPGGINPVVAGTTIMDTWANPTLNDVAQGLTDSLDRSGRGSMLAAFKAIAGSSAAPGITFSIDTTTGFNLEFGAGLLQGCAGGVRLFQAGSTFWTFTVPVSGAAATFEVIRSNAATGSIGYGTGAGGTVTQITSKATGVTLNRPCGTITMHNAALAAATIVSFVLTNSLIEAGDILTLNHKATGTLGAYTLNARCAAGSATIDVRNATAGSLSEAIAIGFTLHKAATA